MLAALGARQVKTAAKRGHLPWCKGRPQARPGCAIIRWARLLARLEGWTGRITVAAAMHHSTMLTVLENRIMIDERALPPDDWRHFERVRNRTAELAWRSAAIVRPIATATDPLCDVPVELRTGSPCRFDGS